jgi:hypothetical protein
MTSSADPGLSQQLPPITAGPKFSGAGGNERIMEDTEYNIEDRG